MRPTEPLDADRIIEVFDAREAFDEPLPGEGLRDRKKRHLRQRISNVATALFLAEGFEEVSVARIAARSDVSEQTVFNYFPTKESMFFDRADETSQAVADAVRDRARGPIVEALRPHLTAPTIPHRWPTDVDEQERLWFLRRFATVAATSPTLRAAPYLSMGPFTDRVAEALAERGGVEPSAPEVQLTAMTIASLVFLRQRSFLRHVEQATSLDGVEQAVEDDVARSLELARPVLDAFDSMGGG